MLDFSSFLRVVGMELLFLVSHEVIAVDLHYLSHRPLIWGQVYDAGCHHSSRVSGGDRQ